jgi:uncharacterized protein
MDNEKKISYRSGDGLLLSGVFNLEKKSNAFALMAHGINMDKNEWNNLHFRISNDLNHQNISTFRFDYRGHGESEGTIRDMTIIGEYLDVVSSTDEISKRWKGKISLIASSFGAGSCILYAALYPQKINSLILLNPVLDYKATFLNPEVDWGKDTFNKKGYKFLKKNGFILLDGKFRLDAKLIAEFEIIKPYEYLQKIKCPVLTIHGDSDSMVPYRISKKYGKPNKHSYFIEVKNAEHGFIKANDDEGITKQSRENQDQVTQQIINWIKKWGIKK